MSRRITIATADSAEEEEEAEEVAKAAARKKEPIPIFKWLNTSDCMKDKGYLEQHGYVIVRLFDDKNPESEVSDHILNAILDEASEEKKTAFRTRPEYTASGRKLEKHALIEYFKKLTNESHQSVSKETRQKLKAQAAEGENISMEGKIWYKNRIFHKLHLPSLKSFGWAPTHTPTRQHEKLSKHIEEKLEIFFSNKSAEIEILAYHASIPHIAEDTIDLCPVNPDDIQETYVGHLAATDITFCMLSTIKDIQDDQIGQKLATLSNNMFKYQRVITIPAGCALIHDRRLRYVPLENMFLAINKRHMWACTFHISLDNKNGQDVSDDEGPAANKKVPLENKKVKEMEPLPKRRKKAEVAAVGESRLTYVPNEAYTQTGFPALKPEHIPALQNYILQLEASISGMNELDKLNTEARIARAHQTLIHARSVRDAQA
jgi:hypothetical protein